MTRGRTALVLAGFLFAAGVLAPAQESPSPTPAATPTPATTAGPAAETTPAPDGTPAPEAAKAAEPLPKCADCHTDLVAAFARNPHARWSHKGKAPDIEEFCSTCHGDGTKHIEGGGDAAEIQKFHGAEGAELCLSCHEKTNEHASFAMGFHANSAAVNCLSCHAIHGNVKTEPFLLAKKPGELCQTCHAGIVAAFRNKPYAHRLDRGGMTCLDCHDPHDRKGQTVKLTRAGELACLNCHAEKRGPFVFDHVTGTAGDCLSCHQPHGSNNPKMLLWARVDQMCLSCHSQTGGPATAGPQPPSFHDLTLPRYRNCTSCHVAVHGSNLSPVLLK
jgi:DmsE family decaheme c-type cytochrome